MSDQSIELRRSECFVSLPDCADLHGCVCVHACLCMCLFDALLRKIYQKDGCVGGGIECLFKNVVTRVIDHLLANN